MCLSSHCAHQMPKLTSESSFPEAFLWNKNLAHLLYGTMQLLFYSWPALRSTASQEEHWEDEKCAVSEFLPHSICSHTTFLRTLLDIKQELIHNNSISWDFWFFPLSAFYLVLLTQLHLSMFADSRLPEGCHRLKGKHRRKDVSVEECIQCHGRLLKMREASAR